MPDAKLDSITESTQEQLKFTQQPISRNEETIAKKDEDEDLSKNIEEFLDNKYLNIREDLLPDPKRRSQHDPIILAVNHELNDDVYFIGNIDMGFIKT